MVGGINVDGAREDFLATAEALSQKTTKVDCIMSASLRKTT